MPTNEFRYIRWGWNDYQKQSDNFEAMREQCVTVIKGKKPYDWHRERVDLAWAALKRLVRKYGRLLRENEVAGVLDGSK